MADDGEARQVVAVDAWHYPAAFAFTGMLVGSVSTHCVTSAACPVVVVRGD